MESSDEGFHVVPANRVGHGEQLTSTNPPDRFLALVATGCMYQMRDVVAITHLAVKDADLDLSAGHPRMSASRYSTFAEER